MHLTMGPYQLFSFVTFFLCQICWINFDNNTNLVAQNRPSSFSFNNKSINSILNFEYKDSIGQVSASTTLPVILISSLIVYNIQIQSVIKSATETGLNSIEPPVNRTTSTSEIVRPKIIHQVNKVSFVRMTSSHQWMEQLQSQCPTKRTNKYNTSNRWSPASFELFYALAKVLILIIIKIAVKYYSERHLLGYVVKDSVTHKLIDLLSKALTIAIAKYAIKWALYPALRTASKTFLIALLKALFKPLTNPLVKGSKETLKKSQNFVVLASIVKCALSLAVKVVIKTIVLKLLAFYFENEASSLTLTQLMFRVAIIIFVKTWAKKLCKMVKNINEKENVDTNNAAPVNKTMMFALQKLVTKLVKIPLIKILL